MLKKIISSAVINEFDHALVVIESSGISADLKKHKFKIIVTPFQPTCENLVIEFSKRIKKALPSNVSLVRLKLRETPTGYAEWEN